MEVAGIGWNGLNQDGMGCNVFKWTEYAGMGWNRLECDFTCPKYI